MHSFSFYLFLRFDLQSEKCFYRIVEQSLKFVVNGIRFDITLCIICACTQFSAWSNFHMGLNGCNQKMLSIETIVSCHGVIDSNLVHKHLNMVILNGSVFRKAENQESNVQVHRMVGNKYGIMCRWNVIYTVKLNGKSNEF